MKILFFVVVFFSFMNKFAYACDENKDALRKVVGDRIFISDAYTVKQIELKELSKSEQHGKIEILPFGNNNRNWLRFKSHIKKGDCIFFIETDSASWQSLSGRAGYVQIRSGKVLEVFYTSVS